MIRIHVRKISDEKSLITAVSGFESTVTAIIEGKEYNAKSIMSTVIINNADAFELIIDGPDEKRVVDAVNNFLVLENFNL